MQQRPLKLSVEFDPGGDPLTGRLTTAEGQHPFTGWLGLMSTLDQAVGAWRGSGVLPSTSGDAGGQEE